MYTNAAIALLLAGIKSAAAGECFCEVKDAGESGACGGRAYKTRSTVPYTSDSEGKARCEEFCFQEPDGCVGFAWRPDASGDNCFLYDSLPDSSAVDAGSEGSCYGMLGVYDGFVEVPRKSTGPCGGVCRAPIYAGKNRCDFDTYLEPPECNEPGSYTAARSLEDCKDWCEGRGSKCQGFDFDQEKADASTPVLSCYERRYKPTSAFAPSSSSKYNFKDEFCHARVCACPDVPPPIARNPGWPKETCNRTARPTGVPTPAPEPTKAPIEACADDDEWIFINANGKEKDCSWVGRKPNKRCIGKFGLGGDREVAEAKDACPLQCNPYCS